MAVGFQVWNDWGTTQVDQDHITLAMSAKGSITMTLDPATHPQPMRIGSVTVTGDNPIIAFAPSTPGVFVNLLRQSRNGDQWTFHFRAQAGANFTLAYWTFDKPERAMTGGDGFGIQVFRDDGGIAFDSGMKPLRVVEVADLDPPADGDGISSRGRLQRLVTMDIPAGQTYAIVQGSFCYTELMFNVGRLDPDGPTLPGNPGIKQMTLEGYHSAGTINGGRVQAGLARFEAFTGNYTGSTQEVSRTHGDLMHWIVDVTNY